MATRTKATGDGGRFVGTTWQDLLDLETVDVPEYLRIQNNPDMGDEDLSSSAISVRSSSTKRKKKCGPASGKWPAARKRSPSRVITTSTGLSTAV